MCIFHRWSKWKQYEVNSFKWVDGKKVIIMVEKRQLRKCEKCNKEQDQLVSLIS